MVKGYPLLLWLMVLQSKQGCVALSKEVIQLTILVTHECGWKSFKVLKKML
jgi:hypothetical protein